MFWEMYIKSICNTCDIPSVWFGWKGKNHILRWFTQQWKVKECKWRGAKTSQNSRKGKSLTSQKRVERRE